ncbi:MAG: nucleoside triphosphate pyrophosphatase [Desulfurella sp.]|uniref:nucleoside triphosphate pyrophosphatase n=1 Tax=Desulfurella sp. TaxID=1962857 RepID=UPI000CAF8FE0|nr:nucleoside triphosphate pyrophosphatase [Desulfurella sp.]PMP88897.1 MAG: septum formation inhibitor Maf [Desulfurella sp.]
MVYVATTSPRRIELLEQFGFDYTLVKPCKEKLIINSKQDLAVQKAISKIECLHIDGLVVAFDTIVVFKDKIFEKPKNIEEAKSMLYDLSGSWHSVISAIAIKYKDLIKAYFEKTFVKFAKLEKNDIDFLTSKENVLDKAGAYAIQGYAALYIEKIVGDYYNVVGLPLNRFKKILEDDFKLKKSDYLK